MTQPAKVQEPSMEEILASIRRIIADDEAKPPAADKPASPLAAAKPEKPPAPAAKAPVMKDVPPSAIAPPPKAAPPPKPAPPPAAPPPVSNGQDDIDALLNGLDEATTPEEIRPGSPDGEVFELTDDMAVASPPPSFNKVDPADDLEFAEMAAAPPPPPRHPAFDSRPLDTPPSGAILSRSTVSTVESAFNALANTVLSNNARTLEDLVKEMLRPLLKAWLDDNLPTLVERIVKAEIERVSRGR
jgi:cell pole-organizing protein PopZ